MSNQAEAFAVIDGERNYQDRIWRQRCEERGVAYKLDADKPVSDWLVFIAGYYADAIHEASHVGGCGKALDIIRKMAALCVACMEVHGGWCRNEDGSFKLMTAGPLPRCEVYHLVLAERDYRVARRATRRATKARLVPTTEGHLVEFGHYLRRAFQGATMYGPENALQEIVTLAAICLECMEAHGAPRRVLPQVASRFQRTMEWVLEFLRKRCLLNVAIDDYERNHKPC